MMYICCRPPPGSRHGATIYWQCCKSPGLARRVAESWREAYPGYLVCTLRTDGRGLCA